jgi:adenylate cyclase
MSSRRGAIAFAAVAAVAAAIGIGCYGFGLLHGLELGSVDTRFSVRGDQEPSPELAIVGIDDDTFSELKLQWPFPRRLHAEVIDQLVADGAKAIAFDVQFTEATDPRDDNALVEAVHRAGDVVLATSEVSAQGKHAIFGGNAVLRRIGARAGNTVYIPDSDGTVRRFPYALQNLESFAVASAEVANGEFVEDDGFDGGDGAWIDYAGPPKTIPTYSYVDVLYGRVNPDRFKDKIVVVGATSPVLQDVKQTPFGGELMSGAEVQANAIATVLDGVPLRSGPGWLNIALILLLAAIGPLAGFFMRPVMALVLALVSGLVFVAICQLAFNTGTIVAVVCPLLALVVGAVGTLAVHYLLAAFERQRVRFTFSRFVPEDVVDQVLSEGEGELQLGGVRRESTVLFSDLRGFTSYSEAREPGEVVEVLNVYLGEMTDAIMDHGGTLVSYIGDGIMAVFGAPLEQDDHADRAIAAAQEMLEVRLPSFCRWMQESGHGEGFQMGIGLNSGDVMSGQVGSERRREYTTIGDTTNTASRLEGMTKGTPHSVFISDSTKQARMRPEPELINVGELEVRGREMPLQVWSLPNGRPAGAGA